MRWASVSDVTCKRIDSVARERKVIDDKQQQGLVCGQVVNRTTDTRIFSRVVDSLRLYFSKSYRGVRCVNCSTRQDCAGLIHAKLTQSPFSGYGPSAALRRRFVTMRAIGFPFLYELCSVHGPGQRRVQVFHMSFAARGRMGMPAHRATE